MRSVGAPLGARGNNFGNTELQQTTAVDSKLQRPLSTSHIGRRNSPPVRGGWADLNPVRGHEQAGPRPVVVISHDVFNERSRTVIAMALTSQPQRAGFPLTLELEGVKLPKRSWVKISQIRTLSRERIGRRTGRLEPERLDLLVEGLNELIAD